MPHPADSRDPLLDAALALLKDAAADLDEYAWTPAPGATQATVWHGVSRDPAAGDLALRLTPKPAKLIQRIGDLVDEVTSVPCPRTLAVDELDAGGGTRTVHLCTWIGTGRPRRDKAWLLGRQVALLHQDLASSDRDFSDRPLSFDRIWEVPADQALPTSYVAAHVWRDRVYAWLSAQTAQMATQPIHGDLHWGNVVGDDDHKPDTLDEDEDGAGFGFIDFDKVMKGPRVFDLAKLLATGMFVSGNQTRFQVRKATQLLEGYETVTALSPAELVVLEGLAILLNEQTALLGARYDIEDYRTAADGVARWWIARRRRNPADPLGIRAARKPAVGPTAAAPEPLWPDDGP